MNKESLAEKRGKWVSKWLQRKLTGRAIAELKQQDEQFIKELKEEADKAKEENVSQWDDCKFVCGCYECGRQFSPRNFIEIINKLSGFENE